MYFILFIAIAVASYAVQASLKSKFSTYSKTPLSNGMTGAQVAETAVSFASNVMPWILLAGIVLLNIFPGLLLFGIGLYALTTLFSFVTLPVEINASQRAMAWLSNAGITYGQTTVQAKDALKSAAYTYVVAALASLATLIYYIFIFLGRRD